MGYSRNMEKQDLQERREQERAPVEQAGGGVAEGFEQAEEQLERFASHEDAGGSPTQDAFTPEAESDRAEHGESDQLPEEAPDEVVEDDDGGEGAARDDAEDSPGAADESDPDQATGHPG
jgi:hypothetical protein